MLCYLLWNGLVGSACGQARSSDPRCRACRLNGKGMGLEGALGDIVAELFILFGFRVSVSPGV